MIQRITVVILLCTPVAFSALLIKLPEDAKLDFTGLALKYGGVVEEYAVTTFDGYILKLFRIPGNKTRPVLLMHGLLSSSDDFIIRGNDSLAVALTQAGYDVWFGNYRGNRYSRRHTVLDPDRSKNFWKFGPQEHAYDLATSIDFVLNKTGESKMSLIGHSEGSMITYILGSEKPEYNSKIKVFIAMAPTCHIYKEIKKIPRLLQMHNFLIVLLTLLNKEEVGGFGGIDGVMSRLLCARIKLVNKECRRSQNMFHGWNPASLEEGFLPIVFSHTPAGTSKMNLEHLLQMIQSKRFAKFDFGPAENYNKYGSKVSPEYSLGNVTMRTVLIAAKNDFLSVLEDNKLQAKELPNVEDYIVLEDEWFNHQDFLWSRQARVILHPKVLKILQRHN